VLDIVNKLFIDSNINKMKAYVFPGQGAQFVGMGKDLYENHPVAKEYFDKANEILGFNITDIMFAGTDEELKQTKVTQPAVFLHSVISALCLGDEFRPDMVAGHSLGELSALTAAGALSFEDGLRLVSKRVRLYRDSVWAHRRLGPAHPLANHRQQNRDHQRPARNDRHLPRQPTRSQPSGLSCLSAPGLSLSINNADRLKPYVQTAC